MRIFLLCLWLPLALPAQEPVEIPLQSITFFIMGSVEDPELSLPDVVFQFDDQQGVNGLSLQPGGMAGPFLRPLDPELVLFREKPIPPPPDAAPGTPPTIQRLPVGRVAIPVAWRNVFVLVQVDSRSGRVKNMVPLNQSADVLPAGHLGLISSLNRNVNVRLGDASGELPAGGRLLLPAKRRTGPRGDMVLFLAGARNGNGEVEVLASRRISVNPDFRRLALLFPDAGGTLQIIVLPPAPEDPPLPEAPDPEANGR